MTCCLHASIFLVSILNLGRSMKGKSKNYAKRMTRLCLFCTNELLIGTGVLLPTSSTFPCYHSQAQSSSTVWMAWAYSCHFCHDPCYQQAGWHRISPTAPNWRPNAFKENMSRTCLLEWRLSAKKSCNAADKE